MEKSLVQSALGTRFAAFGPESTGKSTLVRELADHFGVDYVPEFMRPYLQEKWEESGTICSPEDLLPIARGQIASENRITAKAGLVFCDTTLLQVEVYSEYYFDGFCPEAIRQANDIHQYAHYFLTGIDVPWEPDDLRDRPFNREELFLIFEQKLVAKGINFTLLTGDRQTRLRQAIAVVEQHQNTSPNAH
jgi:nicotinamide riboside kinase